MDLTHVAPCGVVMEGKSGTFTTYSFPPQKTQEAVETVELVIDSIQYIRDGLGMFSTRASGKDEFDNKFYDEDDHEFGMSLVESAGTLCLVFPYNSVNFHTSNMWKFRILNMSFWIRHSIIPNRFHNIPRILNVPRSNGTIQKAIIKPDAGVRVRKSRTKNDEHDRIYVFVWYDNYGEAEVKEEMTRLEMAAFDVYKQVPLDELIDLNPDMKEITLDFKTELELEEPKNEIHRTVQEYYMEEYREWIENTVIPATERLADRITINVKY